MFHPPFGLRVVAWVIESADVVDSPTMNQTPDPELPQVANTATGRASGNLVMAGTIHGGVHFHAPARQAVSLPYRFF